jgi:cation diffusion facilitator family transporter
MICIGDVIMNIKVKTASLSILSNSSLIVMKVIVGVITGSVSIISEAIHSTIDLTASFISFFSVKISSKPADKEHPYGHGKFEDVSGVLEGILIFFASLLIIFESIKKLRYPGESNPSAIGFIVMFISSFINFFISRILYKVSNKEDSIALKADALHLRTDVYTSLGVGIGLLLIWITKLEVLDPLIAIAVSIFILREAFNLLKSAFNPLVDVKLSDDEINTIKNILSEYSSVFCEFHRLRTRKSGNIKCIDLHLVFPNDMHVKDAHDICDSIENRISSSLTNTETMIHIESCNNDCKNCNFKKNLNCTDNKNK